jgi:cellulose synthase/poly-beta-1,6-N-acetylglucosamine synthase-like glycosyltransferase
MLIVAEIIILVFSIYILLSVLYFFLFSFSGLFGYRIKKSKQIINRKYAILFPAYKEDDVIVNSVEEAQKINYPSDLFEIIVLSDQLKEETIEALKRKNITILEVQNQTHTKVNALKTVINYLNDKDFDYTIILDADNVMEPDFLSKVNSVVDENKKVIQAHRTAKNKNTQYAILDALSEEINNHIFRKGHRVIGLSAALIGSAIAIEKKIFIEYIGKIYAIGGFDKELEILLLKNNISIDYIDYAYVYDEKIQNSSSFENQRRRWLAAQFYYFGKYFFDSFKSLITKRNINYFNKTIQMFFLPRILTLGLSFIFTIIFYLLNRSYIFDIWLLSFVLCCLTIIFAIPRKFYTKKNLNSLFFLPKIFFTLLLLLFKLKGANKKFIHTKHNFKQNTTKQ